MTVLEMTSPSRLRADPTEPLSVEVVDLFCGVGGLSYGLQSAGVQVRAGIDIDPACRHPFEQNLGADFLEEDVQDVSPDSVVSLFSDGSARVIAGCVPCQSFSTYARSRPSLESDWDLVQTFGLLAIDAEPDVITMENVPPLRAKGAFQDLVDLLWGYDYWVSHGIVDCADYGVPQTRRRLVLLASKHGPISLEPPTHVASEHVGVRETIGHLDPIAAGEASDLDPMHKSSTLSDLNLKRIQASKPGGTWLDWDEDLRANCHRQSSGKTFRNVYGRMAWDEPAPTLTTRFTGFGNGRFGHPEQDRGLSLREGALLQTFPETYSFVPEEDQPIISTMTRLIGNAVPVKIGEALGRSILSHLEGVPHGRLGRAHI